MNHYTTLGVDKSATQAEIKKAYRKLSMQHHPDKGGDENLFKDIAEAYAILGDEQKRQQYDMAGQNPFSNFNNMGGMDGNFSDLFNQFFGQRQQTKGLDVRVDMHISFDEAFRGCSKRFSINGQEHSINLRAGVKTGQKFRLAGKGQPHQFNTQLPAGDLIVTIHVQMSSEFIIDNNNDIWIEVTLPWYEIMSGSKIMVNTLDGAISIQVPRGTTPGKVLRIKDKGWPNFNTGARGSLLCKLNPNYPELNENQLEYIDKVSKNNNE